MFNVVVEHGERLCLLRPRQRLDQEPVVVREEKEAATGARTFTRLEYLMLVAVHVERVDEVTGQDAVQIKNLSELLLFMSYDLEADV